ncbi:methionyl-tRNA formyltransferase [Candidatus Uhrbacteria bacterium]|nr:methionyl-tRNA formyltransferase [Candidatus Uhrbacteria bacterium]
MKIVFFGTPSFAIPFLKALISENGFEVIGVVTQPDKPSGRGKKILSSEVKQFAVQKGIAVFQFASLKKPEAVEALSSLCADVFVVVAYGKIIPNQILNIPPKGVVNVHPSMLPKYRGPSPMQWAILNGDKKTGISIMLLDEGMDTGPILKQTSIDLSENETTKSLETKIHSVGPKFLCEVLKSYEKGNCAPFKQKKDGASGTRLLTKEDGQINWDTDAKSIERIIRAYTEWPTAWSKIKINNKTTRLKILQAKVVQKNFNKPNGTLIEDGGKLFIAVNSEALELMTLQPEGKSQMPVQAFLAGRKDWIGKIFE